MLNARLKLKLKNEIEYAVIDASKHRVTMFTMLNMLVPMVTEAAVYHEWNYGSLCWVMFRQNSN
jgi:hypothetical protein